MKSDRTLVVVILDRSGSMSNCVDDVIGGFNKLIEDQKKVPGECWFTLAQFDHGYNLLFDCVDVNKIQPLTKETFVPRGSTALLDAIGRTTVTVGEKLSSLSENERPSKVLVVIFTDGHENASEEYTDTRIKEMINHQKTKYSWEFIFIGSEPQAVMYAEGKLSLRCCAYQASGAGTKSAFNSMTQGITSYRISGSYDTGDNNNGGVN